MTHTELGALGEIYVARLLASIGLRVEHVGEGGGPDLLVEGVPIEVKAARPSLYNGRHVGYQFCLHRSGRNGIRAAVVILLCYWNPASEPIAFVIPADRVRDLRKVVIPNRRPWMYAVGHGRWARWYNRWEMLADVLHSSDNES